MRHWLAGAAILLVVGGVEPAAAQRLVISLSEHRVQITSNFSGVDLVLFGTIEGVSPVTPNRIGYDLVVTVVGPRQTYRARRKQRVVGIWVNAESRQFVDVPSYLAVLSNRPIQQIAKPDVLRRLQIGLDYFPLTQRIGPDFADTLPSDPFREAFVRLKRHEGLYQQSPTAVTFLTPTVFRAAISLPTTATTGTYNVDVKLLAGGTLMTRATSAFEVIKVGFEQFIAEAARQHALLYGIATVCIALFTGWIASVAFRRD